MLLGPEISKSIVSKKVEPRFDAPRASNGKPMNKILSQVPSIRIRSSGRTSPDSNGKYVLYWMSAHRRLTHNFALQRSVDWSLHLSQPLVILEPLRCGYRWACERFHQFILDGMAEHAKEMASIPAATYYPYVEPQRGHQDGLLDHLATSASVIVTDDFPVFFHPAMIRSISRRHERFWEIVDSNGIIPMRQFDRTFTVAHSFRRAHQKWFRQEWPVFPEPAPLNRLPKGKAIELPDSVKKRWSPLQFGRDGTPKIDLSKLPIDHEIREGFTSGGTAVAQQRLKGFVERKLSNYANDRNEPQQEGSSGLSAHLHFGHISSHEVFLALFEGTEWSPELLGKAEGKMEGFWNLSPNADPLLDQLITWREIGFNFAARERNYDQYESLPEWAQQTLAEHADDPRPAIYSLEEFTQAKTHDPLWNAAQRQLVREGRIHNYLRMLWGKKILHWTRSPQEALEVMIQLNNQFALDGRDPNSYSGIFWVLGRYDRAWGPERPVFGKIRYMTSESTASKWRVGEYIKKYSDAATCLKPRP